MKLILSLLLMTLAGCAWSNPRNRPVWNAFEKHLVPEQDTAFYASLPLTVPAGFVATLADTLVVHPVRVVDDAAGDASDLWRGLDWRKQYYTELGFLPLRVVGTPIVFAFAWLGRACFDVDPYKTPDPAARAAEQARKAVELRAAWLEYLQGLARSEAKLKSPNGAPAEWDAELAAAFEQAFRTADSRGRYALLQVASAERLPPLIARPWLGLEDRDPVVRYLTLRNWRDADLPADLRAALLADENEFVRSLAAETLHQ